MSVKNLTKSFDNLGKTFDIGAILIDKLVTAIDEAIQSEFSVGQRIQFYRKGWAEKGETEPTLAINGTIRRICPKTGWLHVEHKWGWAVVKPDDEKLQVLQPKASKKAEAELV